VNVCSALIKSAVFAKTSERRATMFGALTVGPSCPLMPMKNNAGGGKVLAEASIVAMRDPFSPAPSNQTGRTAATSDRCIVAAFDVLLTDTGGIGTRVNPLARHHSYCHLLNADNSLY
jgi:hypothetical protein